MLRNQKEKIFCISMQRTGTTSVGRFLDAHGIPCLGWTADRNHAWCNLWYEGDYESIFQSKAFRRARAFEDSPWWYPGFYKILYHRFPGSKFILLSRDPDSWFRSMRSHSGGNILGHNRRHCKIYRRENEFFQNLDMGRFPSQAGLPHPSEENLEPMPLGEEWADHYKNIYQIHLREVEEFFERHNRQALHIGTLEDSRKWQKMGQFLGVDVAEDFEIHVNKSTKQA